jgi:hypothetical protein
MTLTDYKSELVQTVSCEITALKRGNLECANKSMSVRHGAQIRVFIIECLQAQTVPDQTMINYLYEQVKEMTRYLTTNNCIGAPCT